MARLEIHQGIVLQDNLAVLAHDPRTGFTAAVDVADAAATLRMLSQRNWQLTHILITHHHWDHTQGLSALKAATGARVIGPATSHGKIEGVDDWMDDGARLALDAHVVEAIATPGHTRDGTCYWFTADNIVFTGDTLFSLGCGRLFEADGQTMWRSLEKLVERLPPDTAIFCGHEYTAANGQFALSVEPRNDALQARMDDVTRRRMAGLLTLPTTLAQELHTNPFLRVRAPEIRATLGMPDAPDDEVFTELRRRKDAFRS